MRYFFLILAASFSLLAQDAPYVAVDIPQMEVGEVETLQNLIAATKKHLQAQQQLLHLLQDLESARAAFQKECNKETAALVIQRANEVKEILDQHFLANIFRPEFVQEVNTIAQMAHKTGITRP